MKYRIYFVPSNWYGLRYHVQFRSTLKYSLWPFWRTGPAFKTEDEAIAWIDWDKANKHAGIQVIGEL